MAEPEKLSLSEKIGYSLGDLAANFVFQMQIMFLPYFYPQVFGISTLAMGWLFFITRIWHAFVDPMIGGAGGSDGHSVGAISAVGAVHGGAVCRAVRADVYDARVRREWEARLGVRDLHSADARVHDEQHSVFGAVRGDDGRFGRADESGIVAIHCGDDGDVYRANVYAGVCVAVWRRKSGTGVSADGRSVCVFDGRVLHCDVFYDAGAGAARPEAKHVRGARFEGFVVDWPVVGAVYAVAIYVYQFALRGGTTLYYFHYFVDGQGFVSWFNDWESRTFGRELFSMQTIHIISLFNGLGIATTLVGVIMSTWLAGRFGKRNVFLVCLFLSASFIGLFVFIPADAVPRILACQVLYNLSYGATIPLLWAMMADVADYSEWRTGRRATGMVFATMMFALNTGQAIGAGLNGWLLRWYGFVEKQPEQSERAVGGILWMFSVYPSIAFFIGCLCLLFYKIDRQREIEMDRELTLRREGFQTD